MRSRYLAVLLLSLLALAAQAKVDPVSEDLSSIDKDYPPAVEEFSVTVDGQKMPALIYLANGAGPHPTVLLLHGFPGNEKSLDIAQAIRRAGFNAVFFNYRGAWGAQGNYRLTQQPGDVLAVLNFLREPVNADRYRVRGDRLSTLGHSMGGYAALASAARDPALRCVGTMSAVNLAIWAQGIRDDAPSIKGFLDYADTLFMLSDYNGKTMSDELAGIDPSSVDSRNFTPGLRGKYVLMVAGSSDKVTPPALMHEPVIKRYQAETGIQLTHHLIPGDHSYSWTRIQLTRLVMDWLERDCR